MLSGNEVCRPINVQIHAPRNEVKSKMNTRSGIIFAAGSFLTVALYLFSPLVFSSLTFISQLSGLTGLTLTAFASGFITYFVEDRATRDPNAIFSTVGSVMAFGGAVFTGVLLTSLLLSGITLISAASALSAISFVATWIVPLVVPTLLLPTAGLFAMHNGESLTESLERITTNVFYRYPGKVLTALGNKIQEGFWKGYDYLANLISGNRARSDSGSNTSNLNSGSSYTQIKDLMPETNNSNSANANKDLFGSDDDKNDDLLENLHTQQTAQSYQAPLNASTQPDAKSKLIQQINALRR
jgi:hypothetical protein